jgi:hypothetical protein
LLFNADSFLKFPTLYKSATTSRAWSLPGAFLIPSALLEVADLLSKDLFANFRADCRNFSKSDFKSKVFENADPANKL